MPQIGAVFQAGRFCGMAPAMGEHRLSAAQAAAFAAALDDTAGAREVQAGRAPPLALVSLTMPHGVVALLRQHMAAHDEAPAPAIHLHERLLWHRPLHVDRLYRVEPRLRRRDVGRLGTAYQVETQIFHDGGLTGEAHSTVVVRRRAAPGRGRGPPLPKQPTVPATPVGLPSIAISADQALRFAAASGDVNPIHLDPAAARQAGLEGCVLHGICTLGLVVRELVRHFADDRPHRLRAIEASFRRPVYLGDEVRGEAWAAAADGGHHFLARNARRHVVLGAGMVQFAPA